MTLGAYDLLWLLLPIAAVSGWFAGRRDGGKRDASTDTQYASGYFRGINYVINEQPDKAIEVFTGMLSVNADTVETHLALGSLFRRRGEVERAIRIHQNLIARSTLDSEQRSLALCELALDYHKAGLLDRAENLFLELAEIPPHSEQALRMLMLIYEQEREWGKAAQCARRVMQISGKKMESILAQYCCEQAEQSILNGDTATARHHLVSALQADATCVRANLLLGQMEADLSRWQDAIRIWKQVEQQDPRYLDEAMDRIIDAYRKLGDDTGLYEYLKEISERTLSVRALQQYIDQMVGREGHAAAMVYLAQRVNAFPTMAGVQLLVDLQQQGAAVTSGQAMDPVATSLNRLIGTLSRYQCQQCGFRGNTLHWQCPACHGWLVVRPVTCGDDGTLGAMDNVAETVTAAPIRKRSR